MFRRSTHRNAAPRQGFAARAALAVALAGGLAFGSAAISTPALAKDKKDAAATNKPTNSKEFAAVYQPVADITNSATGDYAAAKAQFPAVVAAIQNETDRFSAGNLALVLGNKVKDPALQRQGLEMMLQSGQTDPAKVGQYQFFIGGLAYDAKDYAAARTALQAAVTAGYTENDPRPMIAETYFGSGQTAQGLTYLSDLIKSEKAAGKKIPDEWLLRGLKVAYDAKLGPQAAQYSTMLVASSPTQLHWLQALQVAQALNQFDSQAELDLLRLFRETGNLKERRDYLEYVQAADPRRMANEVLGVLDEGVKSGALTAGDQVYTESKAMASARAAEDRKEAPGLVADAKSAANGATAQGAGDAFYSLGDYAQAADMYKLALDKGVKDKDMILTRLGLAQVKLGQGAAAKATLQQVTGSRAQIAALWMAYIDSKGAA